MPISARGKTSSGVFTAPFGRSSERRSAGHRGVTLIEMVTVVAIIGVMAGLLFPAVSSGLDSIRLASAADSIAAYLNSALNRADRRQQVIEIEISTKENALWLRSTEPGYERKLEMPDGVRIEAVLPALPEDGGDRRIIVMPGSTPPRIGVAIVSRRGARRIVRVDPMTGVPRIESPAAES
jgi:prepilin-type N-terminal cleavage/methylation domain-containing protein